MSRHELVSHSPVREWTEAFPLGNGHIGVMVHASAKEVRLQLNDDTCWSGSTASNHSGQTIDPAQAQEAVARARTAALRGDHGEAGAQVQRLQHQRSQSYLPFAELCVRVAGAGEQQDGFSRRLDLAAALHVTRASWAGAVVTQTTRVSAPHDVLLHDVEATRPIELTVSVSSPLRVVGTEAGEHEVALLVRMPSNVLPPHDRGRDPIEYSDADEDSLQGAAVVRIEHDGTAELHPDGAGITLSDVTRLTMVYASATTFTGIGLPPSGDARTALAAARSRIESALRDGLDEVREQQIADHRALYERAELTLSGEVAADLGIRIARANEGDTADISHDPALAALMFHYGRYLLICSSRPRTLPANLQGIWNHEMRPPWSSNYTTNINIQMNYWAAEVVGLPELVEPYFDLVEALAREGVRTAEELYGLPGWTAHHNTDAWAYTRPVGGGGHPPKWAFWPLAGLWLSRQFADSAEFRGEPPQLLDRAFPILRSAAEFALGWLVETEEGGLGTAPSTSPENDFRAPDGSVGDVAVSSTLDILLIGDHLRALVHVADVLGLDCDDVVEQARLAAPRLPAVPIGPSGAVLEWQDAFEQVDPHHRHLSPLLFLYPGSAAVPASEERAARIFLEERGDDSTGWSLAWKLALWARLREGDRLDDLLALFFRDMAVDRGGEAGGIYQNLFAAHPPFQIDGNLGFVAGIAEALVQSHSGEIEILPALPRSLGSGAVRGLIARPGVRVDINWQIDGDRVRLIAASFTALNDRALGAHTVRFGHQTAPVQLTSVGTTTSVDPDRLRGD